MKSYLTTSSPWSFRAGRVGGAPQSQNFAPVPLPAPPRPAPGTTTVGLLSSGTGLQVPFRLQNFHRFKRLLSLIAYHSIPLLTLWSLKSGRASFLTFTLVHVPCK